MDPISAVLAIGSLISGFASRGQASRSAADNLAFQRSNADREYNLATATRTDPYGNTLRYDRALNAWIPEQTEQQQKILSAGEREQLLGLTEDAARNRRVREGAEQRGKQASSAFDESLAGYRYDRPPSEASTRADILRQISEAYGTGDRATAALVGRQGLRQQGNQPVINTGSLAPNAGQKLAQAVLQARTQALSETGQREQQHTSKYLPAVSEFNKIANQGGDAQFKFSDLPDQIRKQTEQANEGVLKALNSGSTGTNYAANQLSTVQRTNPFDLRGIASLLRTGGNRAATVQGRNTMGNSGDWTNPDSITPINSGVSYTRGAPAMPPIIPGVPAGTASLPPWYSSNQSTPGDSWYF